MDASALDQITIAIDPTAQLLLAGSIITLMYAIALGLTPASFSFLKTSPKLFWGGLVAQIIGLPLVTILVAAVLSVSPSIALGMIVVAACPGGSVSNFMTYAARGDVAYSVSLTAGASVIATLWTPFAILFWSDMYPPTAQLLETIEFSRTRFILQTVIMLAVPLAAGMTTAHFAPAFAEKAKGPFALLGGAVLAFVIFDGLIKFLPLIVAGWALVLTPIVVHNASGFALGAVSGRLLGASPARRRSLTFEIGIQNTGLALVLLLSQLQGLGGAAAIAAAWGIWHFVSGGAMIAMFRTIDRRKAITNDV